jgi:hypothetical protein
MEEGDVMSRLTHPKGQGSLRANAVVRLCVAREQLWRAERRHANARGTPAEWPMLRRVGEAGAQVAMREQWLHWIDRGTSLRPEADGDWAPPTANGEFGIQRRV